MKMLLTDYEKRLRLKQSQLRDLELLKEELPPNITKEYLAEVLSHTDELFDSLIVPQKREFLNSVLSNCKLEDKEVEFTLLDPWMGITEALKVGNGGP